MGKLNISKHLSKDDFIKTVLENGASVELVNHPSFEKSLLAFSEINAKVITTIYISIDGNKIRINEKPILSLSNQGCDRRKEIVYNIALDEYGSLTYSKVVAFRRLSMIDGRKMDCKSFELNANLYNEYGMEISKIVNASYESRQNATDDKVEKDEVCHMMDSFGLQTIDGKYLSLNPKSVWPIKYERHTRSINGGVNSVDYGIWGGEQICRLYSQSAINIGLGIVGGNINSYFNRDELDEEEIERLKRECDQKFLEECRTYPDDTPQFGFAKSNALVLNKCL